MSDHGTRTSPQDPIRDAIDRAWRLIRDAQLEIVMNPDDVTDEVRREIEAMPLVTLRESPLVIPGIAYTIRPGALDFKIGAAS